MEIVRELREIPNLSLALGFFDGVHLGHQAVISSAVDFAQDNGFESAIITFTQPPECFLNSLSPTYILPHEEKYKFLEDLGLDYIIELDFPTISALSPSEYLDLISKYFRPKAISTGFNHRFGAGRAGDVKFLSDNQDKYNYVYFATPPLSIFGDMISSTNIKQFIRTGVVDMAASMLGRKFSISGNVIKGRGIGKSIGFPTVNIVYPSNIVEPPYGVYDVDVELPDGVVKRGIANYGVSPTVSNDNMPVLEVYILDFDGDLYDKKIKVFFSNMIRTEMKFDSLDNLKMQISFDLQQLN